MVDGTAMKYIDDEKIQVKVLDDGLVMVRRKDGKPASPEDLQAGLCLADSAPGLTVVDLLRVFRGAKIRQHRSNER